MTDKANEHIPVSSPRAGNSQEDAVAAPKPDRQGKRQGRDNTLNASEEDYSRVSVPVPKPQPSRKAKTAVGSRTTIQDRPPPEAQTGREQHAITNSQLRQLRARINKLQTWLKREIANTDPPTLADVIQSILLRRAQIGQSAISRSIYNLKDASKMLCFLQENQIADMAGLEEKVKSMYGKQDSIRVKLKPIDRRLKTLDEHIKQAGYYQEFRDIYQKYKQLKPRKQKAFYENNRREIILHETADRYFTEHMNGQAVPPAKKWREERDRLTAERNRLYQDYAALNGEVKEVEIIRRSVYDIMRQEQRNRQLQRGRGRER